MNRLNNFGTLRLLLASLVIVSHTPEMLDGDRSRELLTILFGSLSFGEVAVDGFFIISGFLIAKSIVEGRSLVAFSVSRLARIIPGFMVAFWLSVVVLAPFVTHAQVFSADVLFGNLLQSLALSQPAVPGTFANNQLPTLNGSLWTIQWEVLCYVGVALLWIVGLLKTPKHRYLLLAGTLAMLILNAIVVVHPIDWRLEPAVRFPGIFGIGVCYYLFKDRVKFTTLRAVTVAACLCALMFAPVLAEAAFAVLGGYLIFWFAFAVRQLPTSRIDDRADLSYGIYLYGWPVGAVLIALSPDMNPWLLGAATLLISVVIALFSWFLVEKPAMALAKSWLADRKARMLLRRSLAT